MAEALERIREASKPRKMIAAPERPSVPAKDFWGPDSPPDTLVGLLQVVLQRADWDAARWWRAAMARARKAGGTEADMCRRIWAEASETAPATTRATPRTHSPATQASENERCEAIAASLGRELAQVMDERELGRLRGAVFAYVQAVMTLDEALRLADYRTLPGQPDRPPAWVRRILARLGSEVVAALVQVKMGPAPRRKRRRAGSLKRGKRRRGEGG